MLSVNLSLLDLLIDSCYHLSFSGNSDRSLCINLGSRDGEGDGREAEEGGGMCIPVADPCCGLTENSKIL